MKNLRFIDGDNCRAISPNQHISRCYPPTTSPHFFAPLVTLNSDEYNQKGFDSALNHALEYRAPAIHRHLLTQKEENTRIAILRRLFGVVSEDKSKINQSDASLELTRSYTKSDLSDAEKLLVL
jgi:hypothetical protein